MDQKAIIGAANGVSSALQADVFLFNSPFNREIDRRVTRLILEQRRRKNVVVLVVSEGGDPDAAYRISRLFQAQYEKFTAIISGWCKSAGTLCVLGANELVFGDFGELGPLDVQFLKKDEISEVASGLVVREALSKLQTHAFQVFEQSMLGIIGRSNGQVSFKLAADIAARLSIGVCQPLYTQIDPVVLGDLERGMTIAKHYGERLRIKSKNFTSETLVALAESYPSHGFVIDVREAEALFNNVRPCSDAERKLLNTLQELALEPAPQDTACYLSAAAGEQDENTESSPNDTTSESALESRGGA